MSVLRWEEPPPSKRGASGARRQYDHDELAAQLRRRPKTWALLFVVNAASYGRTGQARHIRTGRNSAYRPAGAFEAAVRELPDGTVGVYARYIGEPS